MPEPLRVCPDGDGGVAFEWEHGKFASIDVGENGTMTIHRAPNDGDKSDDQ